MKNLKISSHIFAFMAFMLVSLLAPQMASAKWSKASGKFQYGGVKVEVMDRRDEIGKVHNNTHGYTIFQNSDQDVTVNWKCYGVLKKGGKLVLLNDNSFDLAPNEKRNEVYSYGAGKFRYNDFKRYVISIEVVKKKTAVAPEEKQSGKTDGAGINDKNVDEVYKRLMKLKKDDKLTQEDYSTALDWAFFYFDKKMLPIYHQTLALRLKGKSDEYHKLLEDNQAVSDTWQDILRLLVEAYNDDKLNKENSERFEDLKSEVQSSTSL